MVSAFSGKRAQSARKKRIAQTEELQTTKPSAKQTEEQQTTEQTAEEQQTAKPSTGDQQEQGLVYRLTQPLNAVKRGNALPESNLRLKPKNNLLHYPNSLMMMLGRGLNGFHRKVSSLKEPFFPLNFVSLI